MSRKWIPYILAAMVLISGFASLRQYNVTWDEALGDLFFGQRYFSYFTTFDSRYLDFKADPYPAAFRPDLSMSPFRLRPWEHYPVASTLATATSRLFSSVLDPFDGYHAFNLLIAAIFVVVFYRFVDDERASLAATMSVLFLFLSPRIAADLMANVKDFAEMVFFSLTAIVFFRSWQRESVRGILFSGALWGLALGTKANALFLPLIVIAFVLARRRPANNRLYFVLLGSAAIGGAVFFASWPYLWQDPVHTLRSNFVYLLERKSGTLPEDAAGPFTMTLFTTPLPFLIAFVVGLIPLVRRLRSRDPFAMFIACWLAIVLGRLALPTAINFDGVRHFLELFPPAAIVAAFGVAWVLSTVRSLARGAIAAAIAISMLVPLLRVHPFETAYWNSIAGGLQGAMARKIPQAGDYWGASYRLGLRWLNANAAPHAILAVPVAEHAVRVVLPYRLRPDIGLAHITTAWSPRVDPQGLELLHRFSAERPVYVMFILRRDWSNDLIMESFKDGPPAAAWGIDGAPVLLIFRMTRNK